MEKLQNENVRYIQDTSNLFAKLYKQHGDHFLAEYEQYHRTMLNFFAAISTWDLKEMLQLPHNIFRKLITAELNKRKAKAELLRARGRLAGRRG